MAMTTDARETCRRISEQVHCLKRKVTDKLLETIPDGGRTKRQF